jgi:zinc D-Ala-D-Ala carboxypeptidase
MILRHFSVSEFDCRHTGKNEITPEFLEKLDDLREACDMPFIITSGYRAPEHPIEARKVVPGTHAQGIACDISARNGVEKGRIVKNAIELGFTGIGVSRSFVHVDTRKGPLVVWDYS